VSQVKEVTSLVMSAESWQSAEDSMFPVSGTGSAAVRGLENRIVGSVGFESLTEIVMNAPCSVIQRRVVRM
jgi:hypothetical protein